ncbi:PREDICTED: mast cell protease 1A-like [Hipposideros armiger]|uniref:Mast cell protease 1A-like n=1 Tax=Hipposideros armiger TaxID=186990 RepID=A0A8B7QS55_HIPAR|nr:PREDICTED: mast cell protease 1A-like [Hipposideros armiger]
MSQIYEAAVPEIMGEHEAKLHSHPYMAYLQLLNKGKKRCGGVLMQENFVLTAAHCSGSSITVILGAHNIKQKETTQQEIRMKRAIRHPNYNNPPYANDIMLLQLEKMAKLNNAVWAIKMPTRRNEEDSGGPLICNNMAQGIVSYGKNNGKPPGVYTRISKFLPWMEKTMKRLKLLRSD